MLRHRSTRFLPGFPDGFRHASAIASRGLVHRIAANAELPPGRHRQSLPYLRANMGQCEHCPDVEILGKQGGFVLKWSLIAAKFIAPCHIQWFEAGMDNLCTS